MENQTPVPADMPADAPAGVGLAAAPLDLFRHDPGAAWWETVVLGSTVYQWALSLVIFIGIVIALSLLVRVIGARAQKMTARTSMRLDDLVVGLLASTQVFFILAVALIFASLPLSLAPKAVTVGRFVVIAAIATQIVLWGGRVVSFGIDWFLARRTRERGVEDSALATSMVAVRFIGLVVLYSVVFLVAADNLGFDVTALVAGLGISGIAVALAVQSILGDLFSSLSIVFDKPFVVGDFIIVGDDMGTVEYIGLKTTRVRALSGEQIIISNSDLLGSRIHNYKRMQERRVVFSIGVVYGTDPAMLQRIPSMIRGAIEAQDKVRFDRSNFQKFGASSLDFETVYWVKSPDYNLYMDIQEEINLAIAREFESMGLDFAFPTQTLFVHSVAPSPPDGAPVGGPPGPQSMPHSGQFPSAAPGSR